MRLSLAIASIFVVSAVCAATLDPLTPGRDFAELTVSGSASADVQVTLIDRTEDADPSVKDAAVSAGRFSVFFDGLRPGHEYAVLLDGEEKGVAVMSREMTDGWLFENAATYDGLEVGTGVWGGDGECSVQDGRIVIEAQVNQDSDRSVVYLPTNRFGAASGYWVRTDISFEGEAQFPRVTDGIFGVTLVTDPEDVSRAVFYIIDNQVWKRTDAVGSISIVYEVEFLVDEVNRRVGYYLIESGRRVFLGSGRIPVGVPTRFRSVDFQGFGSIRELEGEGRDCKTVAGEVHFDDGFSNGVLRAGMNFTNLVINGWVSITNLWETGLNGGLIEVRVVGSDGSVRMAVTNAWSGFEGVYGITNRVDGLTRGETYAVEVRVLDEDGSGELVVGDGESAYRGTMGRETDAWYEEDGLTVSGKIPSTGIWTVERGIELSVDDSGVVTVASDGEVEGAKAVFTPTNAVPRNGDACVNSFEIVFAAAMNFDVLPDVSGELFGITLASQDEVVKLAVVIEGSWVTVDPSVCQVEPGRLYRYDVVCTKNRDCSSIEYFVTDESGEMKLVAHGRLRDGAVQYPSEIAFVGDGRLASAVGTFFDTTLMDIELSIDNDPGTNFTAVAVTGTIRVTPTWETDCTNGILRVEVRNGRGELVAVKRVGFSGDSPIDISVDGLEPGESYSVSTHIEDTDGPADGDVAVEDILTPTAKGSGKWIDEYADTFRGSVLGTGDWYYRLRPLQEAKAVDESLLGPAIQIESDLSSSVIFESTNDTPAVVNSTIREITFEICSETPGYSLSDPEFPKMRSADLAGVTIANDDLGGNRLHFSVYDPTGDGSWHVLSNTVAALNRPFVFTVIITYPNPNKTTPSAIAYYLENAAGRRDRIAFFEPGAKANGAPAIPEITESYRTRLRFSGSGLVKRFEGSCYDAHLASIDGLEYWTIADAVREIGSSGRVLVPLWFSTYTVEDADGWFGVFDPNHWLNLVWPLGYVVEITDHGEIRYYLFHLSDYWIDWAIAEDVVETPSGWDVRSANGLAWLAKQSTNEWLGGDITLACDITNLHEHIWTPIRGFTGTFDGNGRTITGLTDKGVGVCWTNSLDLSVYGLFGSASNSVFRNVFLDRVAITNAVDAVASLLGCSIGDLGLTNVVVRSGDIAGGRFVSGIVGYAGDFDTISVFRNFNAATVAITDAPLGGVNASGIVNLGMDCGAAGSVSVVSNENRGAIVSTINSAIGGGNVAQILAGSESEAIFDPEALDITGNIGTGDVSRVTSLNHSGSAIAAMPIVNLAGEVSRQGEGMEYKEFIEANDSTDVVIDPWRLTARMTGAFYQDGVPNFAGMINDQITASKPGDVVTVQDSCEIWSPIELDRAIILELDNKVIDNVFDTYTFSVAPDAGGALVRNGTVTHPAGKLASRPVGDQWDMDNVNTVVWSADYWDRGIFIDGEFVDSLLAISATLHPLAMITPIEDSGFTVNAERNSIDYHGQRVFSLAPLGCKVVDNGDGSYVVEIDDDPAVAPEINLALAPNGGKSKVLIKGARASCEYCLQSVRSLAESWDKPTDRWVSVEADGDPLEFEVDTSGISGFYRIKTRKK